MRTIKAWARNPALQLVLLALFLTVDLVILGRQLDLSKSDWGTWVGSFGTVATLIGTMVLATADRREARAHAKDRAVVAAAMLNPKLASIAKPLQSAIDVFGDQRRDRNPAEYAVFADLIKAAGTWNEAEILPLIVLPNHVCTRLAGTAPMLEAVLADMRDLAKNWDKVWVNHELDARQGKIRGILILCCENIQFGIRECTALVQDSTRS